MSSRHKSSKAENCIEITSVSVSLEFPSIRTLTSAEKKICQYYLPILIVIFGKIVRMKRFLLALHVQPIHFTFLFSNDTG